MESSKMTPTELEKSELYTILINGELYTNIIDDMYSSEEWTMGGYILTSLEKAKECKKVIESYNEGDDIEIRRISVDTKEVLNGE